MNTNNEDHSKYAPEGARIPTGGKPGEAPVTATGEAPATATGEAPATADEEATQTIAPAPQQAPASQKSKIIVILLAITSVILLGAVIALWLTSGKSSDEDDEDQKWIAELEQFVQQDKEETINEIQDNIDQYQELQMVITNDSIIAQLVEEQRRNEELLKELQNTKNADAKEIRRLKEELKTLRAILQDYVHQVDSLQRLNEALTSENQNLRDANQQQQQHITSLNDEREALSEKVNIAAQLDATNIHAQGNNKKSKATEKIKDVKKLMISFNISRNVTAQAGNRSIYIRITTPTGEVLTHGGTFSYQNRNLEYSIRKDIEYNGEETAITVYWDVTETLSAGTYRADIFADGNNIGTTTFSFR